MNAFKPGLWGLVTAKTACALMGIGAFLLHGEAMAQPVLGSPVAVEKEESPSGANLDRPRLAEPMPLPLPKPPPAKNNLPIKIVQPAAAQELVPGPMQRWGGVRDEGREPFPPMIRLDVPGTQVLFRLESERQLQQRMRQEALQREAGKKLYFPDDHIRLSAQRSPAARTWQPMAELVEPCDMGFRKLYFHQINFDRYGWNLGFFQPAVSTGVFYFDVLTFPIQFAIDPCRRFEYNTGWFLPGDPAPLALYPPGPK